MTIRMQIPPVRPTLNTRMARDILSFPLFRTKMPEGSSQLQSRMDVYMPKFKMLGSFIALLGVALVSAHAADDSGAIQKKLASEYALTQPTADNTDIVTAGAVLVLQKSDLVLGPTSASSMYTNVYRDGKIQANSFAQTKKTLGKIGRFGSFIPGVGGGVAAAAGTADSSSGAAPRTYVKGEKMWVTKIEIKTEDKQPTVVFELFTDAVNDVRYKGVLKMPYPKGTSEDQVDKLVAEVFQIQPQEADDKGKQAPAGGQQQAPAQAAAPAPAPEPAPAPAAALPDIPPPPPPADQPAAPPATVSLGQTPDQVIAALGQPQKIVKLAKKETYYYKDLKVIFTAGKVSDVQ
jgi:hypothetical protein